MKSANKVSIFLLCFLPVLSGLSQNNISDSYINIPIIDLSDESFRQVIIDKEKFQYLGHPTTVLLEDKKTMLAIYPKGHGKGEIVFKKSTNGGRTWSDRISVPESWKTSLETPTIHRVIDGKGKKRLIVFSGLYPARMSYSEDDGKTWSELEKVGDWGGVVVMSSLIPLKTGKGHYLAMFHDDLRFMTEDGKKEYSTDRKSNSQILFTLYKSFSYDGGLTWTKPEAILSRRDMNLCEPGVIRSPNGKQLAVLLRENARKYNSQIIFSDDEGKTWCEPRALPNELTGDRHVIRYAPDGRLLIVFRDISPQPFRNGLDKISREKSNINFSELTKTSGIGSPTEGDWVGWIGTWSDLVNGTRGQYRIRLKDNTRNWDCGYSGLELLRDKSFIATSYGSWETDQQPYIICVRFKLKELDKKLKMSRGGRFKKSSPATPYPQVASL
jgi:hypothetical protein